MKLPDHQQLLARALFDTGCFKDKTQSSEGAGFRLKIHDTDPDAPLSPFYMDLRMLQSDLGALTAASNEYTMAVDGIEFDLVAPIPVAACYTGVAVAYDRDVPLITPRVEKKMHGSGASYDGKAVPGQRVLVVDDLITKATSKLQAAEILRDAGLVVEHCVVLVDRGQGGREELKAAGIELHAVFQFTDLLEFYRETERVTQQVYDEIMVYLHSK